MKRDIVHTLYFQLAQIVLTFVTSVFAVRPVRGRLGRPAASCMQRQRGRIVRR